MLINKAYLALLDQVVLSFESPIYKGSPYGVVSQQSNTQVYTTTQMINLSINQGFYKISLNF